MQAARADAISITQPWAPPTIANQTVGVAFLTVTSNGATNDRLLGARVEGVETVELHNHSMQDGIMRMRRVDGGIEIPAGGVVELKPGGLHLMLMGVRCSLQDGDTVTVTLTFERAGDIETRVPVRERPPS